jgi:hypothetical protein
MAGPVYLREAPSFVPFSQSGVVTLPEKSLLEGQEKATFFSHDATQTLVN